MKRVMSDEFILHLSVLSPKDKNYTELHREDTERHRERHGGMPCLLHVSVFKSQLGYMSVHRNVVK
jgi:hypothetical protein